MRDKLAKTGTERRRLTLNRETVRNLSSEDLQEVAGGLPPLTFGRCPTNSCLIQTACCYVTARCSTSVGPCY